MADWLVVGTVAQRRAVEAFAQVVRAAGQSVELRWSEADAGGERVCSFAQPLQLCETPGDLWLPVVWTAKGPLYAEVIGREGEGYRQPIHLRDEQRQPLYALARHCLVTQFAPPVPTGVYLVQFALTGSDLQLGQIWPFPAEPALASLGVQQPDLFLCHWLCLNGTPILDLKIAPLVTA